MNDFSFISSTTTLGNLGWRFGEESDVSKNRLAFFAQNGLQPEQVTEMLIDHGDTVGVVEASELTKTAVGSFTVPTEALVTNRPDTALLLLTADCLPAALFDPENKVLALAHLGWRPTGLRLLPKIIDRLKDDYQSKPENLIAKIGPGISANSYAKTEVAQRDEPDWQPYLKLDPETGLTHIDIKQFNLDQLLAAGIKQENIYLPPIDTFTSFDYFSHRRSAENNETEGRFGTLAWFD